MNLIIDIGNTRIKAATFEHQQLIEVQFATDFNELKGILSKVSYQSALVSSVVEKNKTERICSLLVNPILLDENTSLPIENCYATPQTLGKDRLANAVAGNRCFSEKNVLIIDAGTCLKFDFVNFKNQYLGGSIAPGLQMRYKALHNFTANLPLLNPEVSEQRLLGDTTPASIQAGCWNGMDHEIEGTIQAYLQKFGKVEVIITGGDTEHLQKMNFSQKNTIFADRWLTLKGLNEILLHNVDA